MSILKVTLLDDKYVMVHDTLTIDISQWYYGDILKIPLLVWNRYATGNKSVGAIFVGDSGTGKTDVTNILAHIANEKGVDVVNISSIRVTDEILSVIDSVLELGVVLVLDEYEKTFQSSIQTKLLSILSKKRERKSLVLYTANNINYINEFIHNRPGRVHYLFEFNKLSWPTVIEYCEKHNVDTEFVNDLKPVWQRADKFSIDHLRGIVEEYLFTPSKLLSEIIDIVNVPSLRKETVYEITVEYDAPNTFIDDKNDDNTIMITNNKVMPAKYLKQGYAVVTIFERKNNTSYQLKLNKNTLLIDVVDDDNIRYKDQGFIITATKKLVEKIPQ